MNESLVKTSLFWSYCHIDNEAESNLILELARDLEKEYRLISAEELSVITDKKSLRWGDDWCEVLDKHLDSAQFFVAVITPNYIRSHECVREVKRFTDAATSIEASELFLPMIYVDVPEITSQNSVVDASLDKETIETIKRFQWVSWSEFRFCDQGTGGYRRGVHNLAQRLHEANKSIEERRIKEKESAIECTPEKDLRKSTADQPMLCDSENQTEDVGLMESILKIETQFTEITKTLEDISSDIILVGSMATESSSRFEALQKKGVNASAILFECNKLTKKLTTPAQGIYENAKKYSEQLDIIDKDVVTVIIETQRRNPENQNGFFNTITGLADNAKTAIDSMASMRNTISEVIGISRGLNKPLRIIQTGLDVFNSATDTILHWRGLINSNSRNVIARHFTAAPGN